MPAVVAVRAATATVWAVGPGAGVVSAVRAVRVVVGHRRASIARAPTTTARAERGSDCWGLGRVVCVVGLVAVLFVGCVGQVDA